jgi:glyoxylase-like metal-dependent hydrolase (beta-lactamase superfamily II)
MHVLSGARLRMEKRIYGPGAAPGATLELPVSCFLFRHAHGNLLFDTGRHPNAAGNPEALWGEMAHSVVLVMAAGDNVLSALARVNLAPEDIDIVVNSHLHCDHCGCTEFFSNATIYVHGDDLACARDPASEGQGYFS